MKELLSFFDIPRVTHGASQVGSAVKNPPAMQEPQETWVLSWVRKIPWRREWQPNPVLLPENSMIEESVGLQSIALQRVGHD